MPPFLPLSFLCNRYVNCPRCGVTTCIGDCHALPFFKTVSSYFAYKSPWSDLLNLAKQHQDSVMQNFLHQHLEKVVQPAWQQVLPGTLFIGAPIRKERVLQAPWHPLFIWESSWRQQAKSSTIHTDFILSQFQSSRAQQSRIPFFLRGQTLSPVLDQFAFLPYVQAAISQVVLLDDVLTSGHTAQQIRQAVCTQIQPEWEHIPWELWTFFRTPRPRNQES